MHQKTNFIVCDHCEHQKITYFFMQMYFRTVFLRQCMYVYIYIYTYNIYIYIYIYICLYVYVFACMWIYRY